MTDHHGATPPPSDPRLDPQTRDLREALSTGSERERQRARRIPPLGWIIILLLIGLGVWAYTQYGGTARTPSGVETPVIAEAPAPASAPAQETFDSAVTPPSAAVPAAEAEAAAPVSDAPPAG